MTLTPGRRRFKASINPAAAMTSPTLTACNQMAPGAVCLSADGRKPKRSGRPLR